MSTTKIAVDLMSGDRGIEPAVKAIKLALEQDTNLEILAVGPQKLSEEKLQGVERVSFLDAPEVIKMTDNPLTVLRKRNSSMFKAIEAVKEGKAQAAVSAGNTGALMGMAKIILKMQEGYTRPAIASFVPCNRCNDSFCILDLGANTDRNAEMLVSFAYLGDALHRSIHPKEKPRVGLLNIGEENIKGGQDILDANKELKDSNLNFIGNVEANNLYENIADVVVCDGFTGNVFLKTMEGLSSMIKGMITDAFSKNLLAKMGAIASLPVLNGLKEVMDVRKYNGGAFLGLQGLVVKSHGNADEIAFLSAIEFTVKQAKMNLIDLIAKQEIT